MFCPACKSPLGGVAVPVPGLYRCPRCGGTGATVAVLRRVLARDEVNAIWQAFWQSPEPSTISCPSCSRRMRAISIDTAELEVVRIDACRPCQLVWFDRDEIEQFRALPPPKPPLERLLAPEARQALAKMELARIDRQADAEPEYPEEGWKVLAALAGLPVELHSTYSRNLPVVTWGLACLATVVSVVGILRPDVLRFLAWTPAEPHVWTLLSSFFVHGGWGHLLGNLYFLVVFGDDVEDRLGVVRFLLLIASGQVVADLTHAVLTDAPEVPCVGASGAISAVLAFYAVRLPWARIGLLLVFWYWRPFVRWLTVPAAALFILWVGLQLFLAAAQSAGLSQVSAYAHLGGAAVGLGFSAVFRDVTPHRSRP